MPALQVASEQVEQYARVLPGHVYVWMHSTLEQPLGIGMICAPALWQYVSWICDSYQAGGLKFMTPNGPHLTSQ